MVFGWYAIAVYGILLFTILMVGTLIVLRKNKEEFSNSVAAYWKREAEEGWYYLPLLGIRSIFTEGIS